MFADTIRCYGRRETERLGVARTKMEMKPLLLMVAVSVIE